MFLCDVRVCLLPGPSTYHSIPIIARPIKSATANMPIHSLKNPMARTSSSKTARTRDARLEQMENIVLHTEASRRFPWSVSVYNPLQP